MNFKGVQTLWENFGKFTKHPSQLVLQKREFSWAQLFARIQVTTQVPKGLV
jgi:hypothetical protein